MWNAGIKKEEDGDGPQNERARNVTISSNLGYTVDLTNSDTKFQKPRIAESVDQYITEKQTTCFERSESGELNGAPLRLCHHCPHLLPLKTPVEVIDPSKWSRRASACSIWDTPSLGKRYTIFQEPRVDRMS